MPKHLSWIFGAALLLAASTSTARATAFTLNCAVGGGCSGANNFGTVNVTQFDPNTMLFSITLNGGQFVTTGGHHAFGFNITGSPAVTISDLTAGYAFAGAGTNQGYGSFGYVIDCTACGNGGSSPIGSTMTFKVTLTGGGPLPIGLLTTNSGGFSFSADILLAGVTGVVASNSDPGGSVPEPTTIGLSALGLGAVLLARKRIAS